VSAPRRHKPAASAAPRAAVSRVAKVVALLAIPAAMIGSVYLATIGSNRYATPIGYDAPKYVWRTNLVAAEGLDALPGSAPEPFRVNADRPGFPTIASLGSALLDLSTIRLTVVFPAVLGVSIGLAAGALAIAGLREPAWAFPAFALVAGASVHVSRMAGPAYNDNLLLSPLVVAGAMLTLLHVERRRGLAGAVLLLAAGTLVHWVFVALFAGALLGTAALLAPGSIRDWRRTGSFLDTPSARLVGVAVGTVLVGGSALLILAGGEPSPPRLPRESFLAKLRADLPRYAFPVSLPVAALGGVALAVDPEPARRRAVTLLFVWAGFGAVAVLLLALGASLPAHRFLAFALGLPVLFAAGLSYLARRVLQRARGRANGPGGTLRVAAAAILAAGLAGAGLLGYRAWYRAHPWMPANQLEQAAEAGEYLESIGGDGPIVLLVDTGGRSPLAATSLSFHVLRAGLPGATVPRTLVYLGEPERFLAGEPTLRAEPRDFDRASLRHWPSVRAVLDQNPIALMTPAFNRNFETAVREHPEWRVSQNLAVVQGPRPPGPIPSPAKPPAPMTPVELALLTAALLGVLGVVGGGWSAALVPAGWLERLAVAPAFGIAMLVLVGVVVGRLGATMDAGTAAFVAASSAAAGWALFAYPSVLPSVRRPGSGRAAGGPLGNGHRPAR
jgi:hypothetical protein